MTFPLKVWSQHGSENCSRCISQTNAFVSYPCVALLAPKMTKPQLPPAPSGQSSPRPAHPPSPFNPSDTFLLPAFARRVRVAWDTVPSHSFAGQLRQACGFLSGAAPGLGGLGGGLCPGTGQLALGRPFQVTCISPLLSRLQGFSDRGRLAQS